MKLLANLISICYEQFDLFILDLKYILPAVRWLDPRRSDGLRLSASHPGLPTITGNARQYASNLRFREDMHKHDRLKVSPEQRFEEPVTASMEYGWSVSRPDLYRRDPELFHPRMKSRETAYAEALILGPRHC